MTKLAYDLTLRRPGCVIVAAVLGADTDAAQKFPSESWLVSMTDNMRVYEINDAQLEEAIKATQVAWEMGQR